MTQFLLEIEIISQLSKSGALKALFQNRYKVFSDIELGSKNSHVLSRYLFSFFGKCPVALFKRRLFCFLEYFVNSKILNNNGHSNAET